MTSAPHTRRRASIIALIAGLIALEPPHSQASNTLTLVSGTTTENSGFVDYILPVFTQDSGITINVITFGSGQALTIGRRGDADLLLVHDPDAERAFVAQGHGFRRAEIMHNAFLLLGPVDDPAHVRRQPSIAEAFQHISKHNALFISRGDLSGTHRRELQLWQHAGITPQTLSARRYRETGSGMGATLNVAIQLQGYLVCDMATWAVYQHASKNTLAILANTTATDPLMWNPYSLIAVATHSQTRRAHANTFINWILSDKGQNLIRNFQINGQQVFFPGSPPRP